MEKILMKYNFSFVVYNLSQQNKKLSMEVIQFTNKNFKSNYSKYKNKEPNLKNINIENDGIGDIKNSKSKKSKNDIDNNYDDLTQNNNITDMNYDSSLKTSNNKNNNEDKKFNGVTDNESNDNKNILKICNDKDYNKYYKSKNNKRKRNNEENKFNLYFKYDSKDSKENEDLSD